MTEHSSLPSSRIIPGFAFCPRCGAASLSVFDTRAVRCARCSFKFYFNCAAAVGGLLLYQGKLIIGVRGNDPQKGMLDMPGGFIEFGETAEEALAREVLEEVNIAIADPVYLTSAPNDYLYADVLYKTTDPFFVCKVEDISTLKAGDDVADYRLIAPTEIDPQQLAFTSGRIALAKLLERLHDFT
ncbi:MAG: NUDIX hydrolase [Candidatus Methylumidiphilus sp.]